MLWREFLERLLKRLNMSNEILYFGNFNFKTGFSSINRTIGISKLFHDSIKSEGFVFCKDYDGSFEDNKFLKLNGIHIKHNCSKNKLSFMWYKKTILNRSNTKAVVLYDFPFSIQQKIYRFCKKRGIMVISDITEWYDTKNTPFLLKPAKKLDVWLRMTFVHKYSDALITVSDYLYNHFVDKIGENKVIKIYPSADFFLFERNELNFSKKSHEDSLNFCYCGNPGKGKDNINKLIEVFSNTKLPNVKFFIAGSFDEKNINLNGNHNIVLCGNLNRTKLIELYQKIDYQFIVREPTRANNAGFPTKFVESLCFDVVPIYTPISDLPSFKTSGIMIENCSAVNEDLISSLLNKKIKSHLDQRYIETKFMVKTQIEQFKRIVGDLINAKDIY